ncbi:MAG: flagellar hook-associated protein FlgK [Planctomycetes bacterium]|nr:flagellar hook-associated protein FlgK [Planctomycetota bacterium]
MGLLNSALQIGRSALLSYQGALQTVGNNISSAGSPDYTRLAPQLDPLQGSLVANDLQPGAGVALTSIQRYIDEALEGRLRLAIGGQEQAATRQVNLVQVESYFDDLSGAGVGSVLIEFWSRFDELQNNPEDLAVRDLVVSGGARLADSLGTLRSQLADLGADIDGQIADVVAQADDLARQIANLNEQISTTEAGRRSQATALRDQRDAVLRQLSQILDITVREQPDGSLNVYAGSEAIVQAASARQLIAVQSIDGEFVRSSIRFADTNQQLQVRGGRLAGLIEAREQDAYGQIAAVDRLAEAIISDVNRVHADGQGRVGFTSVIGDYDMLDTDVALNSTAAGLAFPPQSGSFYVTVADDATGTPVAYRIEIDLDGVGTDTTLQSLVDDFNSQVTGATASITSDNRLSISADAGFSFTFGYDGQTARSDTSHVLAALGINTFFSGTDASSIAVSQTLRDRPSLVAAASVFLPGDGLNAGRLAGLGSATSDRLGDTSLVGFFNSISNSIAVAGSAVNADVEASSSILTSLQAQKESISGVSLDEEAIALLKFQRAFQGATRFISVVDDLLSELIALIR